MPWGNQQATYTDMRSSFGDYGGIMATGMMGDYGAGYAPQDQGYNDEGISVSGMRARPVSYLPPPRVMIPQGGMYVSQMPLSQTLGYALGFNDAPRNVSPYELQMRSAQSFGRGSATGVATAGVSAVGIAGGMAASGIGAGIGSLIGGGAGMLIGGPGGALVGAKIGGFVGSMAPSIIGSAVTGGITDLVGQKQDITNYLDAASFRFVGAGSSMADPRSKAGMGMRARREVAETMTEMDIKDKFLNMEDLTRILKSGTEQGIFTGSKDIEDFKKKFKNLAENVKEVAKTFNTTIEESVKVMRDMRGMGMDTNQTFKMTTQADALGRVAGRTAAEMFSLGQQGAEMYRGTGISMQIGFQQTQANLATVRAQRDAGILSQEAIAQAGGEEALAMRMNVGALSFTQTGLGRGMMMSMVKGGKLDQGAMVRFLQGDQTLSESATAAGANISDPANLARFQAHQAANLSALGKQYGGQGLQLLKMASITQLADLQAKAMPGLSPEDAFRSIALQQGNTESEVEAMVGMMKNREKDAQAKLQGAEATRRKQHYDTIHSNFMFTRLGDRISDWWTGVKNVVAEPVNEWVESVGESWKGAVERQQYAAESYDVSGSISDVRGALAENIAAGKPVGGVAKRTRPINLDRTGYFAASSGEKLASRMDDISKAFGINMTTNDKEMAVILDERFGGTGNRGLTRDSWEALKTQTQSIRDAVMNQETIKTSDAYKKLDQKQIVKNAMNNNVAIGRANNYVEALEAASGKKLKDLSQEEIVAYKQQIQERGGIAAKQMEEMEKTATTIEAAIQDESTVSIVEAVEQKKELMANITKAAFAKESAYKAGGGGLLSSLMGENKEFTELKTDTQDAVTAYLAASEDDKYIKLAEASKAFAKDTGISTGAAIEKLKELAKNDKIVAQAKDIQGNIGATMLAKGVADLQQPLKAVGLGDVGTALAKNSLDTKALLSLDEDQTKKLATVNPQLAEAKKAMTSLEESANLARQEGKVLTKEQINKTLEHLNISAKEKEVILKNIADNKPDSIKKAQEVIQAGVIMSQKVSDTSGAGAGPGAGKAGTPDEMFSQSANAIYQAATVLNTLANRLGM